MWQNIRNLEAIHSLSLQNKYAHALWFLITHTCSKFSKIHTILGVSLFLVPALNVLTETSARMDRELQRVSTSWLKADPSHTWSAQKSASNSVIRLSSAAPCVRCPAWVMPIQKCKILEKLTKTKHNQKKYFKLVMQVSAAAPCPRFLGHNWLQGFRISHRSLVPWPQLFERSQTESQEPRQSWEMLP